MVKHIYKKNYLKDVIFRIDFVNKFNVDDFIQKNLKELKKIYPFYSPIKTKKDNIKFNLDKKKGDTIEREKVELISQIFYNFDRTSKMEITSQSLIINYKKYKDFDSLINDIKAIIGIIKNNVELTVGRTGLRYINIFENDDLNPINWGKYIKKSLLSTETWGDNNILQSMYVVNLKKDDCLIKIQYGLFNGEMPNDRVKDTFIFDIDVCSYKMMNLDSIEQEVMNWNKYIRDTFENAVTDDLKDKLNDEESRL